MHRLDADRRAQLGVDAEQWLTWVLEVRAEAMRGRPRTYRSELVRDEDGAVIFDPNLTAATKALELIGKRLGLLTERRTTDFDHDVVYTLHIDTGPDTIESEAVEAINR